MMCDRGYVTLLADYPVTNHLDAGDENLGWIRGVFDDGLPFEAELWCYERHKHVTVMIPATYSVRYVGKEREELSNVLPIQISNEYVNAGVLPVGMERIGYETDDELIHMWIYYLEEKRFINFIGQWRNGAIQYVVDANGNVFSEIIVELEDGERILATMDISWNEFPKKKKKNPFRVIG